jgi:hypothetical protein
MISVAQAVSVGYARIGTDVSVVQRALSPMDPPATSRGTCLTHD